MGEHYVHPWYNYQYMLFVPWYLEVNAICTPAHVCAGRALMHVWFPKGVLSPTFW